MTSEHYNNELIKEKRETAGLTQADLADKVNVHAVTISRVESGQVCSFMLLCQIAEVFEMDWRDLLRPRNLQANSVLKIIPEKTTFAVDCA